MSLSCLPSEIARSHHPHVSFVNGGGSDDGDPLDFPSDLSFGTAKGNGRRCSS
jgi:hypothetical protein